MSKPIEHPYPASGGVNTLAAPPSGVKLPPHLRHIHAELAKAGLFITGLAPIQK